MNPGTVVTASGTTFTVWAPAATTVTLHHPVLSAQNRPSADLTQTVRMKPGDAGYWVADVAGLTHGDRYAYSIDGAEPLPDPASGRQPDGVHHPSAVVDPARFDWSDASWRGRTLDGTIVYELHVGTFTTTGTFDAAIAELSRLVALGITTIEVMPVNAFPGSRNWGYDGVFPYAVHESYGGPEGLARFVDAAHAVGLAVILDVVYNHLGPEGNYLGRFGPYFTDQYATPWGPALNVAEHHSDEVRRYFIENAVRWVRDFHIDGFRFDAIHAIVDPTADPFWAQVCDAARAEAIRQRRQIVLIAESSDNDPRQLHRRDADGIGFDAVWCDDVHHSLRVAATGDRRGYYVDYDGTPAELADTVAHRWRFRGQYSAARGRRHGRPVDDVAPHRFVACTQNHDQVGNRPAGDRPDHVMTAAQRRLGPATVLLSPYTPMLFMGEEYGERRPFPFFVDHTDPAVLNATNTGRRAEFAGADWSVDVPEPGALATFESAVLDPTVATNEGPHRQLLEMYTELLRLRRSLPAIAHPSAVQNVICTGSLVMIQRTLGDTSATVMINESDGPATVTVAGQLAFASDAPDWGGDGATATDGIDVTVGPWSVALITG